MNTPLDLAIRNWRSGEYSVHLDRLLEMRESDELTPEEHVRLEAELRAMNRWGVMMDDRVGWHIVEARDEAGSDYYVVAAVSMDWACFYVWEETGRACFPAETGGKRLLVLRTLKSTSPR